MSSSANSNQHQQPSSSKAISRQLKAKASEFLAGPESASNNLLEIVAFLKVRIDVELDEFILRIS